jgi:methylglyoxal synthase
MNKKLEDVRTNRVLALALIAHDGNKETPLEFPRKSANLSAESSLTAISTNGDLLHVQTSC